MSEAAVKLLEVRVSQAVDRLREVAEQRAALESERRRLLDEIEALGRERTACREDGLRRDDELRSALAEALAALGGE